MKTLRSPKRRKKITLTDSRVGMFPRQILKTHYQKIGPMREGKTSCSKKVLKSIKPIVNDLRK
jgi:hypothetical protein